MGEREGGGNFFRPAQVLSESLGIPSRLFFFETNKQTMQGKKQEYVPSRPRKRVRVSKRNGRGTAPVGPFFAPDLVASQACRDERTAFANTIHARNAGENRNQQPLPSAMEHTRHVDHPPSVVWRLEPTRDLSMLGRDPEFARRPPGGTIVPLKPSWQTAVPPKQGAPRGIADYWYAPPQLPCVLQRGFGSQHVAVPPRKGGNLSKTSDKVRCASQLGLPQRILLEGQSSTYRSFPHRVQSVIRRLRRKGDGRKMEATPHAKPLPPRWFTLGRFMDALEQETGYRLVYLRVQQESDSPLLEARLGYALEQGGRYFAAVCWRSMKPTIHPCEFAGATVQENSGRNQIVWWGNAGIGPQTTPEVFSYACSCTTGGSGKKTEIRIHT